MQNKIQTKICESCGKKFSAYKETFVKCPKCVKKNSSSDKGVTVMHNHSNQPRQNRNRSNYRPRHNESAQLTDKCKIDGFYTETGVLRKEIYDEISNEIAMIFTKEDLKSSALRRFYESVRATQEKYQSNTNRNYEEAISELNRLKPLVEYSEKRDVTPRCFTDFMKYYIDLTEKDERNLKGFKELFMSVVGYSKK